MSEDLVEFVLAFEASLEEQGWDAVPMVLARIPDDGDEMVFDVAGVGDPYEILGGVDSTDVMAYVVSTEGWAWPSSLPEFERIGRPSEHPDRVEVRSVVAVTSTGEAIVLTRERGEEPSIEHDGRGPLVEAMTAALKETSR